MMAHKTVQVCFNKSKSLYTYKVPLDIFLAKDDLVVVPAGDGFQVATVKAVSASQVPQDDGIRYKWVVQKVDFSSYTPLLAAEE